MYSAFDVLRINYHFPGNNKLIFFETSQDEKITSLQCHDTKQITSLLYPLMP